MPNTRNWYIYFVKSFFSTTFAGQNIKTINTYINNYYDDVTSQINEYYKREFEKIETVEEMKENINKVTIDEVINLNKKISLSTIYLLRGEAWKRRYLKE